MVLTEKQKEEVNRAILEYLINNGYSQTSEFFEAEAKIAFVPPKSAYLKDILEKKWLSIISLSKKVMELEAKVSNLNEEMANSIRVKPGEKTDQNKLFPKPSEKAKLTGHRAPVTSVCLHPTFTILASCSEDGSIRVWDFESSTLEKTLKGHTGTINAVTFDSSGNLLASASSDLTIKLWDPFNSGACIRTFHGHDHSVSSVAFLPEGEFLVSASRDKSIKLWEVSTGYCKRTYEGHSDWVRGVACNFNGNMLASCSTDEKIMLWKIETPSPFMVMEEHENVIETVIFLERESTRKSITDFISNSKGVKANGITETSFLASASRDKTIRIWNCSQGSCIATLIGHDDWVKGLALHHSGNYLYSCSDDKSIRVWDLSTGKCNKKYLDAHSHFINGIASAVNYLVLISCSVDMSIKVWECGNT